MHQPSRLLPALALTVTLSACSAPNLIQAIQTAQSLIKLVDRFSGKLTGISTKGLTADTFRQVVSLTEGAKTGKLPCTAAFSTMTVDVPGSSGGAAGYQVFGPGATFMLLDTSSSDIVVGTGSESPQEETTEESQNLELESDLPIFEASSENPQSSQYHLLDVPANVDLRPQMPAVRNQGQRGTCVLFSTAGYMDYFYQNDPNATVKHASPEFMNWTYNVNIKSKVTRLQGQLWQDRGSSPPLYHTVLRQGGMAKVVPGKWPYVPAQQGYIAEESCPYQPDLTYDDPNTDFRAAALKRLGPDVVSKIEAGQSFPAQGANFFKLKHDLPTFKTVLAAAQPIQISVPIYQGDWGSKVLKQNNFQIPEMTDDKAGEKTKIGYHSVLLVGYKDDASAPGGGWFIMRNSWGDRWGDGGYAYVSYDFVVNYAGDCYAAKPYSQPFQGTYTIAPKPDSAASAATSAGCEDPSGTGECSQAQTQQTTQPQAPTVPLNSVPVTPVNVPGC